MSKQEQLLKLGFMTTKEMNLWFGLVENSHSLSGDRGKKKLEELSKHCVWEKVYGGFEIKEIYPGKEIYLNKKTYDKIKEEFLPAWKSSNNQGRMINQNINVANIILKRNKNDLTVSYKTVYNYVSNIKVEDWGKSKYKPGKLGYCRYVIVKCYGNTDDGTAEYVAFTPDEMSKKMEIHDRIFGKMTDEEEEHIIATRNQCDLGLITTKERDEILDQIYNFYSSVKVAQYFTELSKEFNCRVISATELVEKERYAW